MKRREFIPLAGGAVAWPMVARAQQPSDRVRRIGVLMNGTETDGPFRSYLSTFTDTLGKLGWRAGNNVHIEVRWTGNDPEGMRAHAVNLVGQAPELILASSSANLAVVLRATRSISCHFCRGLRPSRAGVRCQPCPLLTP